MKIKNHPQVFVEVFVDGRYEIHAPAAVKHWRDAFAVAALKNYIPRMIREAPEGMIETGWNEALITEFSLRTRLFHIELKPVK